MKPRKTTTILEGFLPFPLLSSSPSNGNQCCKTPFHLCKENMISLTVRIKNYTKNSFQELLKEPFWKKSMRFRIQNTIRTLLCSKIHAFGKC